jgi:hypothetical protein
MRSILTRSVLCLAFLLSLPLATSAWEEEILKGTYTYRSSDLSISFDWTEDWVKHLVINGHEFPKATNDMLGKFGSTAFVEIRAEEQHGSQKIIKLLFFCDAQKPLLISGYYADMNDFREDGTFHVVKMKAIEMTYKPPQKDLTGARHVPLEQREPEEQSVFSMEDDSVLKPVPVPEGILQNLKETDRDVKLCLEKYDLEGPPPSSWFEASQIHLGDPNEIDFVVMPAVVPGLGCLIGANVAPFWIYRKTSQGFESVFDIHVHHLKILRSKWNGFREIRVYSMTVSTVTTEVFRFEGDIYHSYFKITEPIN